jgi:hypothetical protein
MSKEQSAEYWVGELRLWMKLHSEESSQYNILSFCKGYPCYFAPPEECFALKNRFFASRDFKTGMFLTCTGFRKFRNNVPFYCVEWIKHV